MDSSRSNKEDVIRYLLEKTGGAENAVMVGDTAFDVIGAKAHGIPTIGVSWGYGETEDMLRAGAVAIADTTEELFDLLTK
jgi:phosphoglycolate phosphatase